MNTIPFNSDLNKQADEVTLPITIAKSFHSSPLHEYIENRFE